jgi:hypothetical protein
MKIPFRHPTKKPCKIFCPSCHTTRCWRHGSYTRTWFHFKNVTRTVWRYYCTSASCPRRTFTVQAVDVLPYCRFLIPDLLKVDGEMFSSAKKDQLEKIRQLDRGVIRRITIRLENSRKFLQSLIQEITDGEQVRKLLESLEVALKHYCDTRLKALWYRSIYRIAI